jgi:histidinol-phosphate/aromatic aminotransferase/cobyric acid decarboxylase-like protein
VSAAALAAVQALSRQPNFVSGVRERMLADRAGLLDVLRAVGLEPLRSVTPYCVAKVPGLAADLRRRSLLQHGVLIRDCASFGMPHHIRVCARPPHDVKRLDRALRQAL